MKLNKSYILLFIALLCIWPLSCAKRHEIDRVGKPKKIKEDPVAGTYVSLIRSELERYQEEPVESLEAVNEIIEKNPEVGFFYYQRAVINADCGKWEVAVDDCREALRRNPELTSAMLLIGKALGVSGQHQEAIKYLEEVRRREPDREDVYAFLAKEYMNAQEYKKAERVMLDLLARDSEALVAYYYLGAIYGAYMKKPQKAINIYEGLLERECENIEVIEAVSQLYLEIGKPKKALGLLLELEKHRPNDVSLKLKIAQIFYKLKEYPPAIERFEQILEWNPDSDKIMYYLGILYEGVGRLGEAGNMYEKIPPISGLYKDARLRLAYIYKSGGEIAQAQEVLHEGVNKQPRTIEFYQYLGSIYEGEGDYENAIKVLLRAARYFPEDEDLFFALGMLYERKKDYNKAISTMRKVLKLNPKNAGALNYIGYALVERGENLEEAEDMLQEAVILQPNDGYVIDSLGWLYFKKGDYTRAFFLLEKAIKLEPKEPTILKHIGQLYLQRGEREKALEYFRKALTIWQEKEVVDQDEVEEVILLIQEAIKND